MVFCDCVKVMEEVLQICGVEFYRAHKFRIVCRFCRVTNRLYVGFYHEKSQCSMVLSCLFGAVK